MTIGKRVAEIRKDFKLSQEDFAEHLLTSRSHIANIEADRKILTEKMTRFICIEFSVNEDWLLTGEGDKYNHAVNDIVELEDSARGIEPKNPRGHLMARAIELAAQFNEVYPNICLSCDDLDQFLQLLMQPAFADVVNALVFSVRAGSNSFALARKLLTAFVPDTLTEDEKRKIKEARTTKQQSEPLSNYLHALYKEYKRDKIWN